MRSMRRTGTIATLLVLFAGAGPSSASDAALMKPKEANPAASHRPFMARQQIEAEVSEVDRDAKVLRLKTEAGRLSLPATGTGAAALKRGDVVVVDVALSHRTDPATLPRLHEDPPPVLTQRLQGSVAGIQRTLGVVVLTTPAGQLTLQLPSAALASLRTGTPVVLELAVRQEPDVSALAGVHASRSKKGLGALLLMLFGRTK